MSKTNKARALAVVSILALVAGFGAPAVAETLADAVALAYQTNPGLQAQRAALRALDENYAQARAAYGLNANIQAGELYQDLHRQTQGEGSATNPTLSLNFAQPLFTTGRLNAQLTAAEADIMAGRQTLRRFETDLLQKVIQAYVGVRRDQQILQISQNTVAVLRRQLADTQARYDVREVTVTDVHQAEARLASAQSQLATAIGQLAVSRAEYVSIMGKNPEDLAPEPPLEGVPATIEQAFDAAESNNPALVGAEYQEQSSRAHVAQAKAGRLPTVNMNATLSRAPTFPFAPGLFDDSFTVQATVTQPLYSSGQLASQIRQALEQDNRDRFSIEDARRTMNLSVAQAWEQLAASRAALVTQAAEEEADEKAFSGVRLEEQAGLRSTIEILNQELELQQAQVALVQGRFNEYISRASLLAAMGLLSPEHLAPGVDLYDPAANFKKVRNSGALPWEAPFRALDALAGQPISGPKPAVTADIKPGQTTPLPPPPADAAHTPPVTAITEIMAQTESKPVEEARPTARAP